jgi:hypothetical protein
VRLCTVKEEYFRPLRGHKNSNNTLYLVNGGSRKFTEIIITLENEDLKMSEGLQYNNPLFP